MLGDSLLESYIPVVIFVLVGLAVPAAGIFVAGLLSPKNPTKEKATSYECGELPIGSAWHQYNMQYYMYAILLIIFDVEVLFLYPWAVMYIDLGWRVFYAMLAFLVLIFLGLIYEWKKGGLEWLKLPL